MAVFFYPSIITIQGYIILIKLNHLEPTVESPIEAMSAVQAAIASQKQYIRNENLLSDFETLTISTDSNNPTIMPYDGFLSVRAHKQPVRLYVNGVLFMFATNNDAGWGVVTTLAITKGDSVYTVSTSPDMSIYARYFKQRDYSGRS